ncbi:MAG TPA: DNA polymerase III subunit alpha [Nevskiaceae bacterium]|nr:DNA polymerase III subunit alpha [Nevskiaceae bacterium]
MSFVHLRIHTEYSLTDSIVRVEPPKRKGGGAGLTLTAQVAALGQPALAVTDRSNLFAMVKVYKAAEAAGIKPIVGSEVWLAEAAPGEGPERLTLLVQNEAGYRALTRLLSRAYTEGQGRGSPLVERAWLAEAEGLIALSGREGAVYRHALAGRVEACLAAADELAAWFPDRLYWEVARCQRPGDEEWVEAAVALSRHRGIPLVATNDVRFLERKDFAAHEARVCIAQGRVLADEKRPRDYTEEQYLKSSEEMQALFADLPEAIANSLEIARRCTLSLSFGTYHLPLFPVPEGHSTDSWLREQAALGLQQRLRQSAPAEAEAVYRQRLDYELSVIEKMGFAGYFLVVADFIAWAKSNGCPVGPGRGSGAGSLVAYSLGITDLDPLPYALLFERFLNPERVSMPDFDVDFCMDNRERVIDYVTEKYGRERVGQIITYATMAARGVVRDVCRVLGHGYGFGDRLAKLIPGTPGATLADAVEEVPELRQAYADEEDVRAVLELALELEGITRGVGVHAGGVVIAPRPLTDYAPLFCEPGGAGLRTQFDMKDLESVGLVKFDFLGLKTLTVIQTALEMINPQREQPLDMLRLPLDDAATYRLYATGETAAVFQMESPGMQKASCDLKPDTFEDIIALVSLYRPGPMELIPEYCARKRGDAPVTYLHPAMEEVLKPTYGIFVYQEQVMQMSQKLAGYSLGGADLLRRAMGKKIKAEMDKQRGVFVSGALRGGVEEATATAVFDLMEKFANYGFNKSHAAAYALVSYQTAWLKAHYPAEFMAAVMSCDMDHTDTVVAMLEECRRMGLSVQPPDINRSGFRFSVPAPREIVYGLGAIKGVGEGALESILAARARDGAFRDLFDFCRRVDLKKANKRVLEALIYSGSLDGFGLSRESLIATLPKALQHAEREAANADSGQNDLFGAGTSAAERSPADLQPEIRPEAPLLQRLAQERATLGFYLSGHPIDTWRDTLGQITSGSLRELIALHAQPAPTGKDGKPVWQPRSKVLFGAWVTDLRFFKGRPEEGGRASYKVTVDDRTAQLSSWVDVEKWARFQNAVKVDQLCFVLAELGLSPARDGREAEPRLYNPEFFEPDQILREYAQRIRLRWQRPASEVAALRALVQPALDERGTPLVVEIQTEAGALTLDLPARWKVKVSDALLAGLRRVAGEDCVTVQYRRYQPPVSERRLERSFAAGGDDE